MGGFPSSSPTRGGLWGYLHYLFDNHNNILGGFPGNTWYVDTVNGNTSTTDGNTWGKSFATMSQAFNKLSSGDRIYFRGNVKEQLTTPVNIFDVQVIGVGNIPRNSDAVTGYFAQTSATWRAPASPAAATPLCKVLQQGWSFQNILFNGPSDAAAVRLFRDNGSDPNERDASHASFYGCRFDGGTIGIECIEVFNVRVEKCEFYRITAGTGYAIKSNAGSGVALPLNWQIEHCVFVGNDNHIVAAASAWLIKNCVFSAVSVTSKIDLTGGQSPNSIINNQLGGTYSIAGGYTASGATDEWSGNFNSLAGGVTAANPA